MDDMDLSPRLMACLSLSVFFGRLGPSGAVGKETAWRQPCGCHVLLVVDFLFSRFVVS